MNHETVEKLYDLIDDMAMLLVEHANMKYVDALVAVGANIVSADVLQDVDTEIEIKLFGLGKEVSDMTFQVEEVRKALQLALLKGMKADGIPMDTMTPDSIALIIGHLVAKLNPETSKLKLADFTCGTGNLLTATLNTLKDVPDAVYGVDVDYQLLELAKMMADMQDYEIKFFHQSSTGAMAVPQIDVIIGDLPTEKLAKEADAFSQLAAAGCDYLPYHIVENHLNYLAAGGFGIYVIGNDFFSQKDAAKFHEILTSTAEIGMLLQLPETLFKDATKQKSIFVIRKHQIGQKKAKEALVGHFPSLSNIQDFRIMLTKLEKWITMNEWMRQETSASNVKSK